MNILLNDIDNIISECDNQINDKIQGINYLEQLKFKLIDKLKNLKIEDNFKEDIVPQEIKKKIGENNLVIKLEKYLESTSIIKKKLLNDHLFIILNGSLSLQIYENLDNIESNSFNIFKNVGVSLSKDTIISSNLSKESVLISIINLFNNKDFEK